MKKFNTLIVALALLSGLSAQTPLTITETLVWEEAPVRLAAGDRWIAYWPFEGAVQSDDLLPVFGHRFPVESNGQLRVEVLEANYTPFDWPDAPEAAEALSGQLDFNTQIARQRAGYFGRVEFVPIVKNGSQYERLSSFKLRVSLRPAAPNTSITLRGPNNTENSKLSDGDIFKVAVAQTGMHKLTYAFLKEELGMDIDNVNPAQIQVLGIPGGKLPYYTEAPRTDDLTELPIRIEGGGDGSFDNGDYLLFYGQGPNAWTFDADSRQFDMQQNIYSFHNYYFIKVASGNGQRISEQPSLSSTEYTSTSFNDYSRFEPEEVNLMHEWSKAQGSGKHWYGDHFKVARSYTYPALFDFPNLSTDVPVYVKARAALRARTSSGFQLQMAGTTLESGNAGAINSINTNSDNIRPYASTAVLSDSLLPSGPTDDVTLSYPFPQGSGDNSEGWVDWVQFNVRRNLIMNGTQMGFRDARTLDYPSAAFELSGAGANVQIWDITNPLQPAQQQTTRSGNQLRFSASTGTLREFIAFDPGAELLRPEAVGPVENQNLHGITEADMVIVYHPDFEAEALRLAQHRSDFNDFTVQLVTPQQIFNEFGGGRPEPTAIRDFCRMVYERSNRFKYLLLMGDASFDNRDIYELGGNFIPVYQNEDYNPVQAFPTDDFLGIMYSESQNNPIRGELQLAIGRLPAKTLQEAQLMVDKILRYEMNAESLGDWRNRLVYVADDYDGPGDAQHYVQADRVAKKMEEIAPAMNLEKIYLDAFPQESTPGGERFPLATEKLNQTIFKGALAVTYLGHGGPKGWAQERVLNISDILSWDNNYKMPIFITATCTFAGYDDPTFVSAGEEVILNPDGGAASLMTTVRAVFTSGNEALTTNSLQYILSKGNDGLPYTAGEALRLGKLDTGDGNNTRKFALLGDPAMMLALPAYRVATTSINEQPINPQDTARADTLRALQQVTIAGMVLDNNGNLDTEFNGIVYPTLFDKAQTVSTLGQGENNVFNYRIQNNVIFRGRASVSDGRFEFTFVVPKDINYELGSGKISYYAADEGRMIDAAGAYEDILIGGTDPNAVADNEGPQVEVYMNTEDFVFGSTVDPNPTLLVKLQDNNGINVVGNSIGHDLEGVLNEDTQNALLLNDFYESELDDYTRGTVRYPMNELPEGRHQIEVKAWDVANNSATGYTEFVVAGSGEVALQHVLNYPNPFTDRTCFQFDHNLANQEVDILIQIYTVSGRLVKTLQQTMVTDGALRQDDCIEWDGRDDFGDPLARGVYLYKVKVRALTSGLEARRGESEFEKLVILK